MIKNNITKQTIQTRYIRFELLNRQLQIIGELNGVATGGNIGIDSSADVRRTGSIQMVIQKTTINLGIGSPFWLDKYIRVYVGIESLRDGEIVWNNCGLFIVDAPTYEYNATSNTISLSLLDLMAKLTGMRNGYMEQTPVTLKANESIREAFIATLKLAGFNKYLIEEPPSPGLIPNDMEFGQGTTYYNILAGLRDIYPNHEIFFDTDGTFIYREIPTGKNDPVLIDDSTWKHIVISENSNVSLSEVKNAVEVFGRIHEPQYFASKDKVTFDSRRIYLSIPSVTEYIEDTIYGFEVGEKIEISENASLKVNNLSSGYIYDDDETTHTKISLSEGEVYCVQLCFGYQLYVDGTLVIHKEHLEPFLKVVNEKYNKNYTDISQITEGQVNRFVFWHWLGHLQAHGYAEDTNPASPYYIGDNKENKIYIPLFDGEYANCITDGLAQQRAEFELYLRANLKDNITLQCVPVYWFDVNMLVEYTSGRTDVTNKYLIKNINLGLDVGDTMSLTMMRYYPIEK